MSKQTNHRVENLRVLEGPPDKLKGRVMVCCGDFRGLEIWQRADFVIDRKSIEQSDCRVVCPIPACRQTIKLEASEMKWRMGAFASYTAE